MLSRTHGLNSCWTHTSESTTHFLHSLNRIWQKCRVEGRSPCGLQDHRLARPVCVLGARSGIKNALIPLSHWTRHQAECLNEAVQMQRWARQALIYNALLLPAHALNLFAIFPTCQLCVEVTKSYDNALEAKLTWRLHTSWS